MAETSASPSSTKRANHTFTNEALEATKFTLDLSRTEDEISHELRIL